MLLLWLFTLVAGVANACTLKIAATHGHGQAVSLGATPGDTRALDVIAGPIGLVPAHDDDGPDSKAPCLKACDEGTRALSAKSADVLDPGAAAFAASLWPATPVAVAKPGHGSQPRALPPPAPPARLLFSRLSL